MACTPPPKYDHKAQSLDHNQDLFPRNQSLFDNSGNAAVASPERNVGVIVDTNGRQRCDGVATDIWPHLEFCDVAPKWRHPRTLAST